MLLFLSLTLDTSSFQGSFESNFQSNFGKTLKVSTTSLVGILETSQKIEFFDPRCLQVLILRIVFTFGLAPASNIMYDVPSLQQFCSVWKSGICWCNDDGITVHLELAENGRSLALKMRSDTVRPEGLINRSKIMSTIRETVECFGRNVNVIESVINPDEAVKHPLKNLLTSH